MAQTKQQIQAILDAAHTSPRHRFGQNFMIDQNLVRLIATSGLVAPGDWVLEVGPGTGTLTDELLTLVDPSAGGRVVAVEIDRDLGPALAERLADRPAFTLVQGDALAGKHKLAPPIEAMLADAASADGAPRSVRLVANLPYNIASPLIIELLIAGAASLTFTVQKEVADRLRAAPDTNDFGPLTVMAQMLARVEVLRTLPPQAFWPAPKIDSSLVRMSRDNRLGPRAAAFSRFVTRLFSARRKTLRNGLSRIIDDADAALARAEIDPAARVETLSPTRIYTLFETAGAPDVSDD